MRRRAQGSQVSSFGVSLFGACIGVCAVAIHFELRDAVGAIYDHHDRYKYEQNEEADYLQVI